MTIKRLIRYAADNGFDAIAIPKARFQQKDMEKKLTKKTIELIQNKFR